MSSHTTKNFITKFLSPLFKTGDPLSVFDIGYHKTPSAHTYGPAVRDYYLIHLIERGKGYIERGGTRTYLEAGEAFLIRPDEVTVYSADKNDPWEYSWISFGGTFAKEVMTRATEKLYMKYQKSGLLALKNALSNKENDVTECMKTLFEVLNSVKETHSQSEKNDPVSSAVKYIENNYFYDIDITSLASELGFSRAYFTTLFTKRTGESPYGYLTRVRLEKAKEYLRENDKSVETVALSVGFSSVQRFSETFKKRLGISPFNYRKNNRGKSSLVKV